MKIFMRVLLFINLVCWVIMLIESIINELPGIFGIISCFIMGVSMVMFLISLGSHFYNNEKELESLYEKYLSYKGIYEKLIEGARAAKDADEIIQKHEKNKKTFNGN